jgi:hypothetical protein
MATFSFNDLSGIFPQEFMNDLRSQVQRKCPALSVLAMKKSMTGQNIQWAVSFNGQVAANVDPDGGNLLTAASDARTKGQLDYGYVSAPISVTTKAQMLGYNATGPAYLKGMVAQNLMEALTACSKYINQQIFNGTGSSNQMTGLSTAVAASGIYATINPSLLLL